MKRIALVTAITAVVLLIDGAYLQLSSNEVGGDSGILFGNPNLFLSAGTVVLISGGLMLVGAGIMWAVAMGRKGRLPGGVGGQLSQPPASEVKTQAGAGQTRAGKGQEHQRQA
jgi:hypothetical protein